MRITLQGQIIEAGSDKIIKSGLIILVIHIIISDWELKEEEPDSLRHPPSRIDLQFSTNQ